MSAPQATPPATFREAVTHTGRRVAIATIAVLLSAVAIGGSYAFWGRVSPVVSTDNAYVKGDLTYVAPKVSGYVLSVDTENNRRVAPGDLLVRIDPTDYETAVRDAEALVHQQLAALQQVSAQERLQHAQIRVAAAAVQSAAAARERDTADLERFTALAATGFISRQGFERAKAQAVQARSGVAESVAQVDYAKAQLSVLAAQRKTIEAQLESARAKLRKAQNDLAWTKLRAPREGLVVGRNIRLGEYVTAGSRLLAVAPSQGFWIEANLRETQLARIAPGDRVEVKVDALPGQRLCGTVESIARASGSELSVIPPDNATGNFTKIVRRFPVRILLDPGQPGLERVGAGMSAVPRILVGSHARPSQPAGWPRFACERAANADPARAATAPVWTAGEQVKMAVVSHYLSRRYLRR